MNAEIIGTISESGLFDDDFSIIKNALKYGVKSFRFNLSKCRNYDELQKTVERINKVRDVFEDEVYIMLDFPIPKEKIRIYIEEGEKIVRKGELIYVSSDLSLRKHGDYTIRCNCLYTEIIEMFRPGDKIAYADGEMIFTCLGGGTREMMVIRAEEEGRLQTNKSLVNMSRYSIIKQKRINYLECLEWIDADSIALSFVESAEQIDEIIKMTNLSGEKIFSKIESETGIKKSIEIAEKSNVIYARGDMLLNIPFNNFFNTEKAFLDNISKRKKYGFGVASGIMESMRYYSIPRQADLIDIGFLSRYNLNYLIINYGLMKSNYLKDALMIIKEI